VLALVCLVHHSLERWGLPRPRIALAGLNPHARGEEERGAIEPAASRARDRDIDVTGPVSPDTVFRQCLEGRYDVVISMYHDQGQIALKTTAFEGACSIYLGLPWVHLTLPHGSAMDIAGRGIAQHASMLAAMTTAAALAAGHFSMET
jgi:4-hydroxythreonine-4-phosphate dehydrogenase